MGIHTNHSTAKSAKLEFRSEMLVFFLVGQAPKTLHSRTPRCVDHVPQASLVWYVLAYMTQPL
jgi:hypothetical protein